MESTECASSNLNRWTTKQTKNTSMLVLIGIVSRNMFRPIWSSGSNGKQIQMSVDQEGKKSAACSSLVYPVK
uniref:Uncharacterized protein n=1 Tax=Anguilla anguilla TaxID=7936 RepID=A0A0E9Q5Y1_ANGAN